MRTKLIAGNWKMNTSLADAHVLANGIKNHVEDFEKSEVVLCPPAIWLSEVAHIIPKGQFKHLKVGAQNMHSDEAGALTGEISPLMIKELAEYVIIGHSERTHRFHEDAEFVNAKLLSAVHHGLTPILCIGEDRRTEGSTRQLVHQLNHLVHGLSDDELKEIVVAYEPVWAISGHGGTPANPEIAQEVISALRTALPPQTRILYGGSANAENARGFLEQPDVDGLLVGGASLKLKDFVTMCQIAEDLS